MVNLFSSFQAIGKCFKILSVHRHTHTHLASSLCLCATSVSSLISLRPSLLLWLPRCTFCCNFICNTAKSEQRAPCLTIRPPTNANGFCRNLVDAFELGAWPFVRPLPVAHRQSLAALR